MLTVNGIEYLYGATLDTCVLKGTFTASGTVTIPAVTLGDTVTGGSQTISNVGSLSLANTHAIIGVVDNGFIQFRGSTNTAGFGALITLTGKTYGNVGQFELSTPDAALTGDTLRMKVTGGVATAVLTLSDVTVTGLNITSGQVLQVAGVQVIGPRVVDARCDDVINTGDATSDGVIDALRDAMIAHGLIAAA